MDPMPAALIAPQDLHPALWLGHQLGRARGDGVASGFAELDAQLPGGGWPRRALTELLLPQPGIGELRLLAPVLQAVSMPVVTAPPAPPVVTAPPAPPVATAGPSSRHRPRARSPRAS